MKSLREGLTTLILGFCASVVVGQTSPKVLEDIGIILAAQSKAWNEGDIETFMKTYWANDDLQFLSSGAPTFGYQNTLQNYYVRYPNREAMGQLTFEIVRINKRSRKVYSLIGKYHLERNQMDNLEGYFLLIIQKIKGEWKIVADSTH